MIRTRELDWLVVQFAFQLLVIRNFSNGFHEIFLHNVFTFSSKTRRNEKLVKILNFDEVQEILTELRTNQLQCKRFSSQRH